MTSYPERQRDHAGRMARFAIDVARMARTVPISDEDPSLGNIRIRVGLHCGPAVACVIGGQRPRLSFYGDTVRRGGWWKRGALALVRWPRAMRGLFGVVVLLPGQHGFADGGQLGAGPDPSLG